MSIEVEIDDEVVEVDTEPSWLDNYFDNKVDDYAVWRWSAVDDFGDRLQREILYNLGAHNTKLGYMAAAVANRRNK